MPLRLLFLGDVVGRPGRRVLRELLPGLREELAADLVVVNVENSASGFGLTEEVAAEILDAGADLMTGGNHLWDKRGSERYIAGEARLACPANYPPGTPGHEIAVAEVRGVRVGVFSLQGRVFMPPTDCPFRRLDALLEEHAGSADLFALDFHAEATSEKLGMGRYADGRLCAVVGTHTHVQTADEQLLPGGTAYITDLGMTGPHDSVLGMRTELSLRRLTTALPTRLEVAKGDPRLHGLLVEVDPETGRATRVERIARRPQDEPEDR